MAVPLSDQKLLTAVKSNAFYILGAMRTRIQDLDKAIAEAENSGSHLPKEGDDEFTTAIRRSTAHMLEEAQMRLAEYRRALADLQKAGLS